MKRLLALLALCGCASSPEDTRRAEFYERTSVLLIGRVEDLGQSLTNLVERRGVRNAIVTEAEIRGGSLGVINREVVELDSPAMIAKILAPRRGYDVGGSVRVGSLEFHWRLDHPVQVKRPWRVPANMDSFDAECRDLAKDAGIDDLTWQIEFEDRDATPARLAEWLRSRGVATVTEHPFEPGSRPEPVELAVSELAARRTHGNLSVMVDGVEVSVFPRLSEGEGTNISLRGRDWQTVRAAWHNWEPPAPEGR